MKRIKNQKQLVFNGKLLKLFIEKKTIPNGYRAYFETIRHPGAVLIVPFLGKDRVILIRQYRGVVNSFMYELPAGTLGKGENPMLCAKRELIEEIGYATKKIKQIGEIYPAPGYSDELIHMFKAEQLVKTDQLYQDDEVIESLPMTRREIRTLFKKGKITDAKTISGLALCGLL